MSDALLAPDPLLAATMDKDASEALSDQTPGGTQTTAAPHRARGHGHDLPRPHAEKIMLNTETGTEMMPAQPRPDAAQAPEQAQNQTVPQPRDLEHAGQQMQHLAQQQSQQQLLLPTQRQEASSDAAAASAQPQLVVAHASDQAQELQAAAQTRVLSHAELQTQHPVLQQPQQQTLTGGRGGLGHKKPGEKLARTEGAAGSSSEPAATAIAAQTDWGYGFDEEAGYPGE
eukprot:jgi/Chrpa1/19653/Chrysochromulina_OHIO_Genome00024229-RA